MTRQRAQALLQLKKNNTLFVYQKFMKGFRLPKAFSFLYASQRGFTLIEIMVVLAIIGMMISVAPKSFFSKKNETKNEIQKFEMIGQTLRNKARVKSMSYRLVFEFPKKDNEGFKYWIESSSRKEVAVSQEELERRQEEDSRYTREEDKVSHDGFRPDEGVMKKPKVFEANAKLISVEHTHSEQPITEGRAYVHFFSNGQAEESAVHIQVGEKAFWTIYFKPLTGGVEVVPADKPLREIRPQ